MENNYKLIDLVKKEVPVSEGSINAVLELSKEGSTVPFIARYRKDRTGNLDEVTIREILEKHDFFVQLEARKEFILKTIESQKKLTPDIKKSIEDTWDKTKLEDIYLPFKPKKKTKGSIAKEQGIEPFADLIWRQESLEGDPHLEAARYISEDKGVKNLNDVYQGAIYILAERISDTASLRQDIRNIYLKEGVISSKKSPRFKEKTSKFDTYFDYKEKISVLLTERGAHRYLAITRGETENVLLINVDVSEEKILNLTQDSIIKNKNTIFNNILEESCKDAFLRLIKPSISNEIRSKIKSTADDFSIKVFSKNLSTILLASPFGGRRVIGIDPAFVTGCKIVVLDQTGNLLYHTVIFPTEPRKEIEKSEEVLLSLANKYFPEAIVIGNGTGSRETDAFVRNFLSKHKEKKILTVVVSESGASIYSASNLAREEFPDLDLTVRGAISIGRRFQDPLAELVKIDPKSVGVGQYQHDVSKTKLKKSLDDVVSDCVNFVGVDLNTASPQLLSYISGLGPVVSQNIVEFRKKKKFERRDELKKVSRFSEKVFEQAAGFLRIHNGTNVLDRTGIHPEAYEVVEKMSKNANVSVDELIGNIKVVNSLKAQDFVSKEFGPLTIKDIFDDLKKPGRDPRKRFEAIEFAPGINEIGDLKTDMILNGIVTNVTNFGAFVDVGVHTDGLVHTSELSNRFVSDPSEVIAVGDRVKVKVLGVDLDKKQISFSIKAALQEFKNTPQRFIKENNNFKSEKINKGLDDRKNLNKRLPFNKDERNLNKKPENKRFDSKKFVDRSKGNKPTEKTGKPMKNLTSNPFSDLTKLIKN